MDFLEFCKDELHWFLIVTSHFALGVYAFHMHTERHFLDTVSSKFIIMVRMILNMVIVFIVYFTTK